MYSSTQIIGARQYAVAASLLARSAVSAAAASAGAASGASTAAFGASAASAASAAAAGVAAGAGDAAASTGASSLPSPSQQQQQQRVLTGGVAYAHAYVRMPGRNATDPTTGAVVGPLCKAALGDSFAAGTIDGPGMFDFTQGSNSTSWLWRTIAHLAHHATPAEVACQHPKGILLATGSIDFPYPWSTDTVPVQLVKLGSQLVVAAVPTEMTTMSGRRTREALQRRLVANGALDAAGGRVVIAGLANDYADYTVTFEEYQQQRYEAGSTIFGPHQLNGYIDVLLRLADDLAAQRKPDWGDAPPVDFSSKLPNPLVTASKVDLEEAPRGRNFGDVLTQPKPITLVAGGGGGGGAIVGVGGKSAAAAMAAATAVAEFVGGNLRNDLKLGSSFVRVERLLSSSSATPTPSRASVEARGVEEAAGAAAAAAAAAEAAAEEEAWSLVAEDGDATTTITSTKEEKHQRIAVSWRPAAGTPPGTYRIVHEGAAYVKPHFWSKAAVVPYRGVSAPFTLSAAAAAAAPRVGVA